MPSNGLQLGLDWFFVAAKPAASGAMPPGLSFAVQVGTESIYAMVNGSFATKTLVLAENPTVYSGSGTWGDVLAKSVVIDPAVPSVIVTDVAGHYQTDINAGSLTVSEPGVGKVDLSGGSATITATAEGLNPPHVEIVGVLAEISLDDGAVAADKKLIVASAMTCVLSLSDAVSENLTEVRGADGILLIGNTVANTSRITLDRDSAGDAIVQVTDDTVLNASTAVLGTAAAGGGAFLTLRKNGIGEVTVDAPTATIVARDLVAGGNSITLNGFAGTLVIEDTTAASPSATLNGTVPSLTLADNAALNPTSLLMNSKSVIFTDTTAAGVPGDPGAGKIALYFDINGGKLRLQANLGDGMGGTVLNIWTQP